MKPAHPGCDQDAASLVWQVYLGVWGNKFEKLPASQLGPPRLERANLGDTLLAGDMYCAYDLELHTVCLVYIWKCTEERSIVMGVSRYGPGSSGEGVACIGNSHAFPSQPRSVATPVWSPHHAITLRPHLATSPTTPITFAALPTRRNLPMLPNALRRLRRRPATHRSPPRPTRPSTAESS
jgi:hypothetical protein